MENFIDKQDRISQLQNEMLVTILSFLNPAEAASTCVLSKRWQYLWTHVNVLNFYFPKMMREMNPKHFFNERRELRDKYIDWVNRVIQSHQGPRITDFKIFFLLNGKKFRCAIDKWFSFAICKSVQRLEVNLSGSTLVGERLDRNIDDFNIFFDRRFPYFKPYTLTDKVNSLIKSPYGLSCIKSLTQLSLTCVNVTGEFVDHFLSNCPLLLGLRVCFSELLINLKVAGPSLCLKFLEISGCPLLNTVDIYAPNLASLICLGLNRSTGVLVRHAPSLVDLTVAHPEKFFEALPANCFSQLESMMLSFDFLCMGHIYTPTLSSID